MYYGQIKTNIYFYLEEINYKKIKIENMEKIEKIKIKYFILIINIDLYN